MFGKYEKAAKQLKRLLDDARTGMRPVGFSVTMPWPESIEIASSFDIRWLQINQEHTVLNNLVQVADLLRAAPSDMPVLVKPNAADPRLIRDAIDLGVHGVLLPFSNSVEQLTDLVAQCKFAPHGNRGFCGVPRAMNYYAEAGGARPERENYIEFVNEHCLFVPIIETLEAAENIDSLLELPEFEVFHVGLADLLMSVAEEGEGVEYMLTLATALCRKIRQAGKLLMGDFDVSDPIQDSIKSIVVQDIQLPYVTDGALLAYAINQSVKIGEASRS